MPYSQSYDENSLEQVFNKMNNVIFSAEDFEAPASLSAQAKVRHVFDDCAEFLQSNRLITTRGDLTSGKDHKVVSMEDFMVQLQVRGVEAERKSSKKQGEYFTYELTDLSKKIW